MLSNNNSFSGCYEYGKAKEGTTLKKLQDSPVWAGKNIIMNPDRFGTYDYYTPCGLKFEMKSRRNKKSAFWETIIPAKKGLSNGEGCIFLFNFTDGLYFIEYNKSFFLNNDCRLEEFQAPERDDANPEPPETYWYIPVWLLKRVSDGNQDELPLSIKQRQQITTYNNLISV